MLNVALFGKTVKQWRDANPGKKGNVRDDASIQQLLVLANMESYNAILIEKGKTQTERLMLLHELAVRQMKTMMSLNMTGLPQLIDGPQNYLISIFIISKNSISSNKNTIQSDC